MSVGFVLTIMVLTTEEKVFIVEHYFWSYGVEYQNGPSLRHVREHYEEQFNNTAPSNKTILAIVEKFQHTGSVLCQRKGTTGQPRTIITNKNHERFLQQVLQSPKHSLQWTSMKLGVSDRSVRRIHIPYSSCSAPNWNGWAGRLQYCSRVLSMTCADQDFFGNIWFSDESHIHLNGYINWQTTRFIGFERPDVVIQKPLHSVRVTMWCTVSGLGILSPYFVKDDAQNPLAVTRNATERLLLPHLCGTWNISVVPETCHCDDSGCSKMELQPKYNVRIINSNLRRVANKCFQYRAGKSLACLQQHFGDHLISRGMKFPFLSHSPDLTAANAYIWGMLKESIFWSDDPHGYVPELQEKIQSFLCPCNNLWSSACLII